MSNDKVHDVLKSSKTTSLQCKGKLKDVTIHLYNTIY